jgi:hypothetical protein
MTGLFGRVEPVASTLSGVRGGVLRVKSIPDALVIAVWNLGWPSQIRNVLLDMDDKKGHIDMDGRLAEQFPCLSG